jgi:hypothetical protein
VSTSWGEVQVREEHGGNDEQTRIAAGGTIDLTAGERRSNHKLSARQLLVIYSRQ